MEHVVFFTGKPGEPDFRRVAGLEEAVQLVESLRNEQGIVDVSVHALTPVPVSFRTYYRVEIGSADEQASVPETAFAPVAPVEPTDGPATEPAPIAPAPFALAPFELAAFELTAEESEPGFDFPELAVVPALVDEPHESEQALVELAPLVELESLAEPLVEAERVFALDEPVPGLESPFAFAEPAEDPFGAVEPPVGVLYELPPFVEVQPDVEPELASAFTPEAEFAFEPVSGPDPEFAPEAELRADVEFGAEPEQSESLDSAEPLIPQVRSEPEAERSLGYFAN